ncbi:hypothetical protein CJ030_MR5G003215 [Morella rubra]|uniref:Protein kinase domain-containing protein n=1 Tax=Morella rubra TaxID=262757 RepID=A0A6A1VP08_9ROSI|nr:hypothetical protein CJ030_MR5G003215 [Morella rubra]
MAPEYAMWGYLTDKADIYSFGVVALEILSGSNISYRPREDCLHLLDWLILEQDAPVCLQSSRLGSSYKKDEAMVMIKVAFLCTNVSPAARPTLSLVVSVLEGSTMVPELVPDSSVSTDGITAKAMREHFQQNKEQDMGDRQTQSTLTDCHCPASTNSTSDLYPINLDSDYFEQRA